MSEDRQYRLQQTLVNIEFMYLLLFQEPTAYQVEKKVPRLGVRRGNLLQDRLPVKFNDPKLKN